MSKPASCLEPTRSKVDPSPKVFPIISSHHCPRELPSSPTYHRKENKDKFNPLVRILILCTPNYVTSDVVNTSKICCDQHILNYQCSISVLRFTIHIPATLPHYLVQTSTKSHANYNA